MTPIPSCSENEQVAVRLRLALEMADSGIAIMRLNLRREEPEATSEVIEDRLRSWLEKRSREAHAFKDSPWFRIREFPGNPE